MQSVTTLNLNLQYPNYATTMHAVQNDKLTRKVTAILYDGSTPFIPDQEALGMVRFHKPDDTNGFYDVDENGNTAVTWEGNVATVSLTEQALTCAGIVLCQLQFYRENGERLTTFTFRIDVEENALTDEDFMSTDYYSVLSAQISAAMSLQYRPPYINTQNGDWMIWSAQQNRYVDSGFSAEGTQGEPGEDGVSISSVTKKSGTGAAGTTDVYNVNLDNGTVAGTFDVYNGANGATGASVTGLTKVSGTGAGGTVDTYRLDLSDGTSGGTFDVYNGNDGQGSPGSATPLMDGTAAVGSATAYSREDHRHPSDTTRAPLASPAFTGNPTAPTQATSDTSTKLATTAFVKAAIAEGGGGSGTSIFVTPQDYGAVGDGVTDDTQAFNDAQESGYNVYVPTGKYKLTNFNFSTSITWVFQRSYDTTWFAHCYGDISNGGAEIVTSTPTIISAAPKIYNLVIVYNSPSVPMDQRGTCLLIRGHHAEIYGFWQGYWTIGIDIGENHTYDVDYIRIHSAYVWWNYYCGIKIDGEINFVSFYDCNVGSCGVSPRNRTVQPVLTRGYGFYIGNAHAVSIFNGDVSTNETCGIFIDNSVYDKKVDGLFIGGIYAEHNKYCDIYYKNNITSSQCRTGRVSVEAPYFNHSFDPNYEDPDIAGPDAYFVGEVHADYPYIPKCVDFYGCPKSEFKEEQALLIDTSEKTFDLHVPMSIKDLQFFGRKGEQYKVSLTLHGTATGSITLANQVYDAYLWRVTENDDKFYYNENLVGNLADTSLSVVNGQDSTVEFTITMPNAGAHPMLMYWAEGSGTGNADIVSGRISRVSGDTPTPPTPVTTGDYLELTNPDVGTAIKTTINNSKTALKLSVSQGNFMPKSPVGTTTINGITFLVSYDGTITANGTATADAEFTFFSGTNIPLHHDDNHTPSWGWGFWLSGCTDGSDSTYYIYVPLTGHKQTTDPIDIYESNGDISPLSFQIVVKSGVTVNYQKFYPMLAIGNNVEWTPPTETETASVTSGTSDYTWDNLTFESGYNLVLPQYGDSLSTVT